MSQTSPQVLCARPPPEPQDFPPVIRIHALRLAFADTVALRSQSDAEAIALQTLRDGHAATISRAASGRTGVFSGTAFPTQDFDWRRAGRCYSLPGQNEIRSKTRTVKIAAATAREARCRQRSRAAFRAKSSRLIQSARRRVSNSQHGVDELYWRVGNTSVASWKPPLGAPGVVEELARYIARRHPELKGFTRAKACSDAAVFRDLPLAFQKSQHCCDNYPSTHHLLILGRCKLPEEWEFYVRAATEKWSSRELERQMNECGAFRPDCSPSTPKSRQLRQLHPEAEKIFKDTYLLDFLSCQPVT